MDSRGWRDLNHRVSGDTVARENISGDGWWMGKGGTVGAGENVIMKRRSTGGDKAPRA